MITAEIFPRDINEEKRVLGGILVYQDKIDDIAFLWPRDFFYSESKTIFEAMQTLRENNVHIDIGTVAHATNLSEDTIQESILECPRNAIVDHAVIVQQLSMKRELMSAGADIYAEAHTWAGTSEALQAWAESRISQTARHNNQLITAGEMAQEIIATLDQPREIGIPRGFAAVDEILGDFEAGNVEIVAGRAHAGKSRYAMSVALQMARAGKRILYFPLEETGMAVTYRLLHMLTTDVDGKAVPINNIKKREWRNDEDVFRVRMAAEELQGLDIILTDQMVFTASEIASACRMTAREGNLDMVVLDYIQLTDGADSTGQEEKNRNQALSRVSRTLKLTARALKTRMLVLSQLSREITRRQDSMDYRLSDLRECGSLEQDADTVMFIHKPITADEVVGPYNVKLIVKKNRPIGTLGTANLIAMKRSFDGDYGSYMLRD